MAKSNAQIAHLWAHRQAGNGGNMHTDGTSLFSYRTVIATWIDGTCFMTSDTMSPTTASKHLPEARHAVSYNCFLSPAFSYGNGYALTAAQYIQAAAEEHAESFKSLCRKRAHMESSIERYTERRQEIIDTAARFTVDICDMPEATGDLKEKAKAHAAQERARQAEITRRREEEQRAQQIIDQGELDLWLQFGRGRYPRSFYQRGADQITIKSGYIGLERNQDANLVVTSQGAEAPLDHVIKALAFYDSRKANTAHPDTMFFIEYHTNGHKIHLGAFTLDKIDDKGNVKAGCHTFSAAEIARFRKQWGL